MSVTSTGDMARQFAAMRTTTAIKSDLAKLSASLSSGRVPDIVRHLNGNTAGVTGIDHSLAQLSGYESVTRDTDQLLGGIQTVLDRIDGSRSILADQLLLMNEATAPAQIDTAAKNARETFDTMVNTLNTRLADRALMGGKNVESSPLAQPDTLINGLRAAASGLQTAGEITAAVKAWFADATGPFMTTGYLGDAGPVNTRQIAQHQKITISARADDVEIRDVLIAAATAAMATEMTTLDRTTKRELVQTAGVGLASAGSGMAQIRSRIGFAQENLAAAQTQTLAERTSLSIARNTLALADPFETATRLQAVQLQLETHFSVIGRLSQLNLSRFLP